MSQAPRTHSGYTVRSSAPAFGAVIFDMDGVLTKTAAVHSRAWKQMFDEYLLQRCQRRDEPFRAFTHSHDYLSYIDGRPRYRGVEAFLASRGITLPLGLPTDLPETETVCGLGNRKNQLFNEILNTDGVELYPSTVQLIDDLIHAGVRIGLATSSRNSEVILTRTGTAGRFGAVVDGLVSEALGLQGKPSPDIFLKAAEVLRIPASKAIVVEDAVSGVRAGAQGGFALVIGVAREGNARELKDNGADVVVTDLEELHIEEINHRVRAKRAAHL